ncbi:MAG: Eco57I restriction-modification methylase domain-containing protein, partial [Promethearchaeota archaeon]
MNKISKRSTLLRNIYPSGGLFTENILLKLRDNPDKLKIGKIDSFVVDKKKEDRESVKNRRRKVFEWGQQKWDEIEPNIGTWSLDDLIKKWLIPFFEQFGHEMEPFTTDQENIDEDSIIGDFRLSFQTVGHKDPYFHFVNVNDELDSKTPSNPNKFSHHDVCQKFVNLNEDVRWIFLSNGRILRLITNYYYSYSLGYLEFDLENIFSKRDVREFNVLYAVISSGRFESIEEKPSLIEDFMQESIDEGVKIGDTLRDNVHTALKLLGNGLVQQNKELYDAIRNDTIDIHKYYAELLRVIYRIIFILYAEQRDMLPGSESLYYKNFSLSSFRFIAERQIKADRNGDLWKKLFITFGLVQNGNDFLEVPCFNGALFDNSNLPVICPNSKALELSNDVLLRIISLLTTSKINNVRQRINFLEVSETEIGGIYESLLDYFPYVTKDYRFELRDQTTERKSTGSYYTPRSLIDILIKTTLEPMVKERLENMGSDTKQNEKVLLDIKICDPACGGGTFLLSALDYLGEKLAFTRSTEKIPTEPELRNARRDILQHCIYGVDKNPLAVELAKISLWLRACVKDKPLNYLDNHIKCGNSLIGLGKKLKKIVIKPKAYNALKGKKQTGIEAENIKLQNKAREIIRKELKARKGTKKKIVTLTTYMQTPKLTEIKSEDFQKLIDMPEDKRESLIEKSKLYDKLRKDPNYNKAMFEADTWVSSYFWPLDGVEEDLNQYWPNNTLLSEIQQSITNKEIEEVKQKIKNIANQNRFFHWYLEFPEVFTPRREGFDLILTNPPWETLLLKEMEFFLSIDDIKNAKTQDKRRKIIKQLKQKNPKIFYRFKTIWQSIKRQTYFNSHSNLYPLTSKGTQNTYALFAERSWKLISPNGYCGIITPTVIITSFYMQDFFKKLIEKNAIGSLFDFENRKKLFDIDSRFRFCLLSISGGKKPKEIIPMTFYTTDPYEIQEVLSIIFENRKNLKKNIKKLPEKHILIPIKSEDFRLFNPNTLNCPSFRIKKDYELTNKLYSNAKNILIRRDSETNEIISNPWNLIFSRMIDMSNDSNLFK